MPREIHDHNELIDAIGRVGIVAELVEREKGQFLNELDIDLVIYGRNYNGKQVGPYARLLKFAPGEIIIEENTWESNIFYVLVEGKLEAWISDEKSKSQKKVGEIQPGNSFGEMAILAGSPRTATVRVAPENEALVLEFTRPALRLLRKLPKFGQALDRNYRNYGLNLALNEVRDAAPDIFKPEIIKRLGDAARFVVYEKNHVLFHEGDPINRLVFIRNGWVQRVSGADFNPGAADLLVGLGDKVGLDFLGAGNCLGLESLEGQADWQFTGTVMNRTEVVEVAVARVRGDAELRQILFGALGRLSDADDTNKPFAPKDKRIPASASREIETGVVDGINLLVMDMDLCVRCGNCSFACHQMHGQSRLVRRGISITRPVKPKSWSEQNVLVPEVCMHCQDPECLTGCPTGAIQRFPQGQIDIDAKTCIGCGDCATQCPYNAISMVPRQAAKTFRAPKNWNGGFLSTLFSLKQIKPPDSFDADKKDKKSEDMLAIKCNLCENTPLNPPGAKKAAYSCEANCPTGALVRVNPREYFGEVKEQIGLIYVDQTHAIGRNIHKSDPLSTLWHFFGVLLTVGLGGAALWGTLKYTQDASFGNTWVTMRWLTGLVGLAGIVWVMLYPIRKQIYRRRAGALRYWMLSHIWLGVVAGIVLLVHGGTSSGGLLTSLLMVAFDLVIASGLFGAACYFIVPRLLTQIEGEPLLLEDLETRREELRTRLWEIGQSSRNPELSNLIQTRISKKFLSFRYLMRQYFRREDLKIMLAKAREEFSGAAANLGRRDGNLLLEAVESAATLRRIDALIYLHKSLKLWIPPHVIFTAAMLVLMLVHIVQVVYFNVR